ncbi:MAG: AAA family ATPase [Terriglobales bacterium]
MRKWMSERLKRRKKTGTGATKEASNSPAPEPLQPRFYDDEPAAPTAAPGNASAAVPVVESRRASKSEPEPALASEPVVSSTVSAAPAEPKPRVSRRRRSRGGRGGSRPRPSEAPAVVEPPTVEASAPEAYVAEASIAEPAVAENPPAEKTPAVSLPAPAVPAQAATPARASKGTVVLAIGLPGSGKSSWFKRHNIHPLSSDLLRELLFDDAQEQRFQDLVFSNLRSMLKARLIARRPMNYVDATNLTPHDRHSWIKLAKDYGYDVQGVFFDVPLEICLERHQRRGRAVPEDVMRKMAGKLKPPTFEEGFSKITVVRVKQKEATAG